MKRVQILTFAGLLTCLGCGENWQAETHPAGGQLRVNGEPAAGAVVELHSKSEAVDVRNSRPWAIVQADGSYTLSTYESGDGAPIGQYVVVVRWPPDVSQPSLADRLGGAYARPEKSLWTVTVGEGENELPPIEIEKAKVRPAESAGGRLPQPGPPMAH